jgi:hypothetical protein
MPRAITISPIAGQPLYATLQSALKVLRDNAIAVDASAQNVHPEGQVSATILLQYADDTSRALRILIRAGIQVKG